MKNQKEIENFMHGALSEQIFKTKFAQEFISFNLIFGFIQFMNYVQVHEPVLLSFYQHVFRFFIFV